MSSIRFKSFSSGSCGNCYFLGTEDENGTITAGILIDAGVSLRRLKKEIEAEGLTLQQIAGVLITHDHNDHVRSLDSYCRKLQIPVWATPLLHSTLLSRHYTDDLTYQGRKELSATEWNEIVPGHIYAKYFVVPHDATQTVGYAILLDGYAYVHMTDVGHMTDEALAYCKHAQTVVIESNYDVDMLMAGPYPYELKMRICKGGGHLSNDQCAQAVESFLHPELKNIFLCHLSDHNNTPQLAYNASVEVLHEKGVYGSVALRPLPRQTPSPLYRL